MRAKKKLIVSMLAIIFVLLAVVATVAITFALTQQTIKTTLNISYTVEDIDGKASATYTIGGVTTNLRAIKNGVDLGNELVFTAADTEDAGNLEFPEDGLALSSTNDNVVIQYTYTNTGDKHFIASMSFDSNIDYDNMKVEYGIWDFDSSSIKYSEQRYALVVPSEESLSYWIRISIDNKAKSASFAGDFSWLLSGCDKEDLAYESLTSLEIQETTGEFGQQAYMVSVVDEGEYAGKLIFPREVNGESVACIASNNTLTQEEKDQITSVFIPNTVTEVGNSAFKDFTNLQNVECEIVNDESGVSTQTVSTINFYNSAFENCVSIKNFVFKHIVLVGSNVFKGCSALESIVFEEDTYVVNSGQFTNCINLKSITINCESDFSLLDCFEGCNNIQEVKICGTVRGLNFKAKRVYIDMPLTLKYEAMDYCWAIHNITNVEEYYLGKNFRDPYTSGFESPFTYINKKAKIFIDPENTYLKVEGNCIINESRKMLIAAWDNFVIPRTVESIAITAIWSDTMTELLIPNTIKVCPFVAFPNMTNLEKVIFESNSQIVDLVGECFGSGSCPKLKEVVLPDSITSIYPGAFVGCDELTTVTFADTTGWQISKDYGETFADYDVTSSTLIEDLKSGAMFRKV